MPGGLPRGAASNPARQLALFAGLVEGSYRICSLTQSGQREAHGAKPSLARSLVLNGTHGPRHAPPRRQPRPRRPAPGAAIPSGPSGAPASATGSGCGGRSSSGLRSPACPARPSPPASPAGGERRHGEPEQPEPSEPRDPSTCWGPCPGLSEQPLLPSSPAPARKVHCQPLRAAKRRLVGRGLSPSAWAPGWGRGGEWESCQPNSGG